MTRKIAFFDRFCVTCEILETLKELGVAALRFSKPEDLSRLAKEHPDIGFVLSVNFYEELQEQCAGLDLPYAVWTFDSGIFPMISKLAAKGGLREKDFLFPFNSRDHEACVKIHPNCHYLPFSASKSFEREPLAEGFQFDILSVMNTYNRTVTMNEDVFKKILGETPGELEKKSLELVKGLMELVVERHKMVLDKNMMMEYLAEYIEQCGHNPFNEGKLFSICQIYGQILSCMQRELCVTGLCETGARVDVFGDDSWSGILKAYPNAAYHANAEYLELPGLYNKARVNLNLTQIQNLDCLPQRIYHLLAAGAFVLTNHSDELEKIFEPGRHLETFRDVEELKSKALYYLRNEDKRLAIARAGHEEFLNKHRMLDRISFIINKMSPVSGR